MKPFPTLSSAKFYLCLAIVLCQIAIGQTIRGKIVSSNPDAIASLEILNLANNHATLTSKEGTFEIKGDLGNSLQFYFQGEKYIVNVSNTHSFILKIDKLVK